MKKQILIDKHTSMFEEVESSKKPGVLATIRGAVSGWKPNRNGRTYSKELWEKAVNSDFVKEQVALKHFIGEADHPEDRLDPAFEHMSHAVSDFEFHDDTSELWATIDILDTPDGHKLKTLLDYSGSLSFSTRGSGDVMDNGEVDPDTYQLFAIDSVIRPSYPTATVLSESENLNKIKPITESEALKVLETYSKYNKLEEKENFNDVMFRLNHRSLNEYEEYGDLEYVTDLVLSYADMDEDEIYDRVKADLQGTYLADDDDVIWDAMASVLGDKFNEDENIEDKSYADLVWDHYFNSKFSDSWKSIEEICNMDEDELRAYFPYMDENEHLNELFGKKTKEEPNGQGGDPKKCDGIESSAIMYLEKHAGTVMDWSVECKANSESFSYVVTAKCPYLSKYSMYDEFDVMDQAENLGKYLADLLKTEYIKSEQVNDRTFKIYLDNYYND